MKYALTFIISSLFIINGYTYAMEKSGKQTSESATEALWHALHTHNYEEANRLISKGIANINSRDSDDNTPLIFLAKRGYTDLVTERLKSHATIQTDDNYSTYKSMTIKIPKSSPLSWCFNDILHTIVSQVNSALNLVKAGANVNAKNKYGMNAFAYALKNDNPNFIAALVTCENNRITIPNRYTIKILRMGLLFKSHYSYKALIHIIDPVEDCIAKEKMIMLRMLYNRYAACIKEIPQEILNIIITYAYPEFALSHYVLQRLQSSYPQLLVDSIPLERLTDLIKIGVLDRDSIYCAWQKKLASIVKEVKSLKYQQPTIADNEIETFPSQVLDHISFISMKI